MSGKKPDGPFPNRLRVLRDLRGMTQQQLADVIGVNKENVSKIERWRVRLQPEHIEPLADFLKVHPGELFRPLPGREDPAVEEAVEIIRSADDETTRLWLDSGRAMTKLPKRPSGTTKRRA